MNEALEIRDLSKSFKDFSLKDIGFSLPKGYIMGLIGPNGAGKTTIIKLILNMLKRQSGEIKVFGLDNIACEEQIKEQVGVVFDQPYYLDEWSLNNVESAVRLFYSNWDSSKFRKYLKEFDLNPSKKVKDLSRGMKMKLMISVALSHDAKLLILDEPTSGLDPVARDELTDMLLSYISSGDRSVLFSTHITSDLEKIADYITFINKGRTVFTGTKDQLMESYCLIKGGKNDITLEQKKKILGLREHGTGFEGLIERKNLKEFTGNIIIEHSTLDDIVVFINKERINI